MENSTGLVCRAAGGGLTVSRYASSPAATPRPGHAAESGALTTWWREMDNTALAFPAPGEVVVATNEGQASPAAVLVTVGRHGGTVVSHAWDQIVGGPVALPGGQVALLTSTVCTVATRDPLVPFIYRLVLRAGAPAAVLGQAGVVLSERAYGAQMVSDVRGDVAVLWREDVRGRTANFLVVRSASGGIGRKEVLPYIGEPQAYVSSDDYRVVLGPRGDLLLLNTVAATTGPGRVVIARYQPAGGSLGPPVAVGRSRTLAEVAGALDDRGGAVIAWGSHDTAGPDAPSPWVVRAAVRASPGAAFGAPRVLDPGVANQGPADDTSPVAEGPMIGGPGTPGSIHAAMAGREPIVEWSVQEGGDRTPIRVAEAAAGGFSQPTTLTPSGALAAPPVGANGAILFVFAGGSSLLLRPGAAPLTTADAYAEPDQVTYVAAAVDPYAGNPVIAWARHTGADAQAPDQLRIAALAPSAR